MSLLQPLGRRLSNTWGGAHQEHALTGLGRKLTARVNQFDTSDTLGQGLTGSSAVTGFRLALTYDPAVLSFTGISTGSRPFARHSA